MLNYSKSWVLLFIDDLMQKESPEVGALISGMVQAKI
jgi:hypothetical protein